MNRSKSRVTITNEIHSKLIEYADKTGMGANRIALYLKNENLLADNSKLNSATITNWFQKVSKSANKADLEAVLNAYETLLNSATDSSCPRVVIPQDFKEKLAHHFKESPYARQVLLLRHDLPDGITGNFLTTVVTGKGQSMSARQLKYLELFLESRMPTKEQTELD